MRQTRSSTKKTQTRLTFTPIPSSPGPTTAPDEAQPRVAAIRYEPSLTPSKMPRIAKVSPSKFNPKSKTHPAETMALPTPAPSSQVHENDEDISSSTPSESEIPVSSKTFGRFARPRATKMLPLTPKSSKASAGKAISPLLHQQSLGSPSQHASAEVDTDDPVSLSSPQKRRASPKFNLRSSARLRGHPKKEVSSVDDSFTPKTNELESRSRNVRRKLSFSAGNIKSSDDDECAKPSASVGNKEATVPIKGTGSRNSEESSEDLVVAPRRRRLSTRSIPRLPTTGSDSGVSREQVANDLQEDLDNLRDSGKCRAENYD